MSFEVWETIQPVPRRYHRNADQTHCVTHKSEQRTYLVLKPGAWTSLFAEKIANHSQNIICDFAFNGGHVTKGGKYFVNVTANCIACEAKLIGILREIPAENETVTFEFLIKDFDEIRHDGKSKSVRVTGSQARSLATSQKPPITLHRNLAAKNSQMFQKAKGRVASSNAIRLSQSMRDEDDGDRDNLMYNVEFVKHFLRLCKLLPMECNQLQNIWFNIAEKLFS